MRPLPAPLPLRLSRHRGQVRDGRRRREGGAPHLRLQGRLQARRDGPQGRARPQGDAVSWGPTAADMRTHHARAGALGDYRLMCLSSISTIFFLKRAKDSLQCFLRLLGLAFHEKYQTIQRYRGHDI